MDGVNFSGTGFCVGDNVTFTCTVPINTHHWSGPGLSETVGAATVVPFLSGTDNQFILTRVDFQQSIISTSLSLTVYSGFDGVTLVCADGGGGNGDPQNFTATVLGK